MRLEFDTPYNHYLIEDTIYNGRPARLLYSGDQIAAMSGVAYDDDPELLFDYNQCFREIINGQRPGSILILGGGAFTLPTALKKERPKLPIDVVEIDGSLLKMAQKYFDFKTTKIVRVYIKDGRQFVSETKATYDLIIVDVFDNVLLPSSFQTTSFLKLLKSRLNGSGLVAINIISALRGERSNNLKSLVDKLQSLFSSALIFPATTGLSEWLPQNYLVIGTDGDWPLDQYLRRNPDEL